MNYFAARMRKDGRYDYTCENNGAIWPVGYCTKAPDPERERELATRMGVGLEWHTQWVENELQRADRYHIDGHATAEEACACYREYILDGGVDLRTVESGRVLYACEFGGCQEFTFNHGLVRRDPYHIVHLCGRHLSVDNVRCLYRKVGESWSS